MTAGRETLAPKRVISAREVVAEIKSEMRELDLMKKYRLSSRCILSLFDKLILTNLLDRADLDLCKGSHGAVAISAVECPPCQLPVHDESDKCPYCATDLRRAALPNTASQPMTDGRGAGDAKSKLLHGMGETPVLLIGATEATPEPGGH